jgi:hypothetical protein
LLNVKKIFCDDFWRITGREFYTQKNDQNSPDPDPEGETGGDRFIILNTCGIEVHHMDRL